MGMERHTVVSWRERCWERYLGIEGAISSTSCYKIRPAQAGNFVGGHQAILY